MKSALDEQNEKEFSLFSSEKKQKTKTDACTEPRLIAYIYGSVIEQHKFLKIYNSCNFLTEC